MKKILNSSTIQTNLDHLEGGFAYKTTTHEIIHCNKNFLQSAGYKNIKKIIGKTDLDLAWQEYANIYQGQEKDLLAGKTYSALYPGIDSHGNHFLTFSKKYLWKNEENQIIGIISYGNIIQSASLIELGAFLKKTAISEHPSTHYLDKKSSDYPLSNREQACLFYITRGKTAKQIAQILGISYRTVETYIERLKQKFQCHTKSELIDAAIKHDLFNILPSNIPCQTLIDSLKNK